jgi:hypothetical protein
VVKPVLSIHHVLGSSPESSPLPPAKKLQHFFHLLSISFPGFFSPSHVTLFNLLCVFLIYFSSPSLESKLQEGGVFLFFFLKQGLDM